MKENNVSSDNFQNGVNGDNKDRLVAEILNTGSHSHGKHTEKSNISSTSELATRAVTVGSDGAHTDINNITVSNKTNHNEGAEVCNMIQDVWENVSVLDSQSSFESDVSTSTTHHRYPQIPRQEQMKNSLFMPLFVLAPKALEDNEGVQEFYDSISDRQNDLMIAAAHVEDALQSRGSHGRAEVVQMSNWRQRCFTVVDSIWFRFLMYVIIVIHGSIAFGEPTQQHLQAGGTHVAVIILHGTCVLLYILDVTLQTLAYGFEKMWKLPELKWSRMEAVLTVMFCIDFIMSILQIVREERLAMPFRCLRLLAVVCKAKNVGHIVDVFALTLVNTWKVLLSIVVFILVFAAIGVHIFMDDYHYIGCANKTGIIEIDKGFCTEDSEHIYTGAYDHIGMGSLRLFSLLSTENFPEIIVPAYENRRANFFYFCIFVFVGHFILMSVLTARIVEKYWEYSRQYIKEERKQERTKLAKAWNIIDSEGFGQLSVSDHSFIGLLKIVKPKLQDEEINEIVEYVDEDADGIVDAYEWTTRLIDALSYEFITDVKPEPVKHPCSWIQKIVFGCKWLALSTIFTTIMLVLVLCHCVLFCCKWYNMTFDEELGIHALKTIIIGLFIVELLIKIVGLRKDLLEVLEILDIACSLLAIVTNLIWYLVPFAFTVEDQFTYHGALAVLSGLAVFCRLGFNSKPARVGIISLFKILPVMFDLLMLVIIIIYLYGILGLEIFQGIEPVLWYDSDHWDYGCDLGFETFACSLMQVFQVCTTSNWHEIMNAAMIASNGWASLYFVTCYAIIDMLIMSLFVAITSEAIKRMTDTEDTISTTFPVSAAKGLRSRSGTANPKFQERIPKRSSGFGDIIGSVFATTRPNPVGGRRQSLAAVNQRRRSANASPTSPISAGVNIKKLNGIMFPTLGEDSDSLEEAIKEAETERKPSYSEIRSKRLKERLQKKKEDRGRIVLAIKDNLAEGDTELQLHEGDEIEVMDTAGSMIKGECEGKTGWFPGSCVVEMTKGRRKGKINKVSPLQEESDDQQEEQRITAQISEFESAMSTTVRKPSIPKRKISNKVKGNHGGWRRQILGDMTVMNKDEIMELKRIVNAPIMIRKGRRSLGRSRRRSSTIHGDKSPSQTISQTENDNFGNTCTISNLPSIEVQSVLSLTHVEDKAENEDAPGDSVQLLAVKQATSKVRRRSASSTGEIPDWVKNLMSVHNKKEDKDE